MENKVLQEELKQAVKDKRERRLIVLTDGPYPDRIYTGLIQSVDEKNFIIIDKYKERFVLSISDIRRIEFKEKGNGYGKKHE